MITKYQKHNNLTAIKTRNHGYIRIYNNFIDLYIVDYN